MPGLVELVPDVPLLATLSPSRIENALNDETPPVSLSEEEGAGRVG